MKLVQLYKRDKVCTFKANAELWSEFKHEVALRGVSICHVMEALMQAWMEGQRATATVVKPVVVNLTMQHVVQRPRRLSKLGYAKDLEWPPNCAHTDDYLRPQKEVGCSKEKEWIKLRDCWTCWLSGGGSSSL